MKINFHKNFLKDYARLPRKLQDKFKEQRNLFLENQFHPLLNNHTLGGKYIHCRSLNITGDIRTIFILMDSGIIVFLRIGSHSELYN